MKKRLYLFFLAGLLSVGISLQLKAKEVENAVIISAFREHIESVPYLNEENMQALNEEISEHVKCLHNWSDKKAYIEEHQLQDYLDRQRGSLKYYQNSAYAMIDDFLLQYANKGIEDEPACRDSLMAVLNDRTGMCETNLNLLERELNAKEEASFVDSINWPLVFIIAVILIGIVVMVSVLKKKPKKPTPTPVNTPTNNGNTAGIVVRRKTATILKTQSLEDVIDNPAYMKVDAVDFCAESAVRRLYIKNTCVKALYEMYAPDLADSNNAKENGCMILGRWVHDAESNEYYVSLEQVVMPGDDAVFKEYELNFGGKIKLSVLEQLRKLRRETNMQYDLTCWVHSHPGLSVFFSNSDLSVQMQLKHPTHPNFLTAIVVDTLTPKEDVGIFTFRRDGNVNSKSEITKLYSLKEWYAWAKKSLEEIPVTPEAPEAPEEAPVAKPEAKPEESSAIENAHTTSTTTDGTSFRYSS